MRTLGEPPRGAARKVALAFSTWLLQAAVSLSAFAATERSANFEVTADSAEVARAIATCAEELRQTLASEWLQSDLPDWETRCLVCVNTNCERLSGDTTYTIANGRACHWQMELRGPAHRIVETLLPHEVLHTVLATHYQGAVPRWADEGAALSVEPDSEQARLWSLEGSRLLRGRRRPLSELFTCEQYPVTSDELRAFYVHGASITQFLLLGGKTTFVDFVEEGMNSGWDSAVRTHYGFRSLADLETAWLDWLRDDRPVVSLSEASMLADAVSQPSDSPILTAELQRDLSTVADSGAQ